MARWGIGSKAESGAERDDGVVGEVGVQARPSVPRVLTGILLGLMLSQTAVAAGPLAEQARQGDVLVRFRDAFMVPGPHGTQTVDPQVRCSVEALGVRLGRWYPSARVYRAEGPPGQKTEAVLEALRRHPAVLYAEPNFRRTALSVIPNDPYFAQQWGLSQVKMPEAWTVSVGGAALITAVVDTGVETTHPDLMANLWKNAGEICGNNVDDDRNGYVDDCYGINVLDGSGSVTDTEGHGTHITGVAAAVGNNGQGIAGTQWRASLMIIKYLGPSGGTVADFLEALEYAQDRSVKVMNLSYGSYSYSQAERDAMAAATDVLFVAAAGNDHSDNDLYPMYPASYDLPNLISVAASDEQDRSAFFTNYGLQSVHVAAPGTDIWGTAPGMTYKTNSGTSAAAAMVSGAVGVVRTVYPALSPAKIKERLMRTVDIPTPPLEVLSSGRMNVHRALTEKISGPYIYRLIPDKGVEGSVITVRGASFLANPGTVYFSGGLQGQILSWADDKILVRVPQGAVSGPVTVQTAEGVSPPVPFTVTPFAAGLCLRFAEVTAAPDHRPVLVVSNPTPEEMAVTVTLVEAGAPEMSVKRLLLKRLEKRFLWLADLYPKEPPPSLMAQVCSNGFVGAAVVSVGGDFDEVKVMPHAVEW